MKEDAGGLNLLKNPVVRLALEEKLEVWPSILLYICIFKRYLVLMYEFLYNEKVLLLKMFNILDIYSHGRT